MNMMELDGLAADIDSLFGIAGLTDDLKDVAVMGLSAGAAVIGGEYLFTKAPWVREQSDAVKAGLAIGLGAAAGIATSRFGGGSQLLKGVGAGIATGLAGWGVVRGVRILAAKAGIEGLGQVSDRDLLLGMGAIDNDITVSDYRPVPGQTDGLDVNDFRAMPGQTNGLGQAGDVQVNDLQPMPGMNGRDGYLAALS